MTDATLRVLVLLAAVQQMVVPFFVNPFRDRAPLVRDSVPSQLEPAGYAFSIWGPIYLLAVGYGIWQLTAAGRADAATARIAPLAIMLYLGSSLWLAAAKYGPIWATMPILAVMAACASAALLIALAGGERSGLSWSAVTLPFALYAGWTVCATFVNIAEVAPAHGFARLGLSVAAYAMLSIAVLTVIAVVLLWVTGAELAFAATILWALIAIGVAGVQRGADGAVITAAGSAAVAVVLLTAVIRWSRATG